MSLEVSLPECEDPLPLGSSPSPDLSSGIPGIVGSSLSSSKVGRMTRSDGTVQLTMTASRSTSIRLKTSL